MSVITDLEALLESDTPITIERLGGSTVLSTEADLLVNAPYLDVLVSLASTAVGDDVPLLDDLVLRGFQETCNPIPFRDAANAVVDSGGLRPRLAQRLQGILLKRIESRTAGIDGLMAAYALEALFRLTLAGEIRRYAFLGVLADIGPEENGLFAEHAAKLLGAAYHTWRENDLLESLTRLCNNDDARGEANFELGLAHLAIALEGQSIPEILESFETSRVYLRTASSADEDRSDAVSYCAAIDLVTHFANGTHPDQLGGPLDELQRSVADRARLLQPGRLPPWLTPRHDRELQWMRLLYTVEKVARDLDRPSWLDAAAVMSQLLWVYDADRTIGADGLRHLIRPRIEAAFVRTAGLLNHLDELLLQDEWRARHEAVSTLLRERIRERLEESSAGGKPQEGADFPELRRVLLDEKLLARLPEDAASLLERALAERKRNFEHVANPVVQKLLVEIQGGLEQCTDYVGEVRNHFDQLALQIILFCMDRQDASSKELGERGVYLRDANAKEAQLQGDLREWLAGNFRLGDKRTEVEGVATGRTDIYVGFGSHRFIIELKRHLGPVDAEVARRYIGQAASYQGTNVKLGLLGILELMEREGPAAGLEDCVWLDSCVPEGGHTARHLVVFKVPGMLRTPSSFST